MIEPRDGSSGLLIRGTVAVAPSVASTAFWLSNETRSGVQALKEAQKLSGVASVCP